MAEKNEQVEIIIDEKAYKLSGVENEKYIRSIADYADKKIKEISASAFGIAKNTSAFLVLVALNIADDYFKERDSIKGKLKKATDNLTIELNKLREEKSLLVKELAQVKAELDEVSSQPVDEEAVEEAEIYKREYETLKSNMVDVKLELNRAKSQLGSAKCEIEKHKTEKNELKLEIEEIQSKNALAMNEIEALKNASAGENDEINELRTALQAVKNENDMLRSGFDKIKKEQEANLPEKLAELENQLILAKNEAGKYKADAERAREEAEQAKKELYDYIDTFNV